jgi:hypothetical protein
LIDGVGVLLCSTCGVAVLAREIRRPSDPRPWLLAALLAPCLGYMFVMDPIWGPYSDWDLFSYVAVPTSLLGSYALLVWGRGRRATAWLVGLALAASSVHVLARFNALDVDIARHRHESPFHLPGFAPGG